MQVFFLFYLLTVRAIYVRSEGSRRQIMPDVVEEEAKKPTLHHVRVGLPGGTVHQLELHADAQLSVVVLRVLQAENLEPSSVRVRLIIAGKLYTDHGQLVKDVLPDGGFIHCAISNDVPADPSRTTDSEQQLLEPRSSHPNEVHIPLEAYNMDGEVRIFIPNLNSQSAFDRLTQAGFTPEEIRSIRRHVRALRREARLRQELRLDRDGGQSDPIEPRETSGTPRPESERERGNVALRPRTHAHGFGFTSGLEGTNADFLMGCIFGYLLGIIILVLLLDSNATRKWRVGIIAGVATNCAFGILRTGLSFQPPLGGS